MIRRHMPWRHPSFRWWGFCTLCRASARHAIYDTLADSPRRSSWRSLTGFIAEGAWASSSGVSLTMAKVETVSDSDEHDLASEPNPPHTTSTTTTRSTTYSSNNETHIPETQPVRTCLRPPTASCPHTRPDLSLARMPTPLHPWNRSGHSPSPYTGRLVT